MMNPYNKQIIFLLALLFTIVLLLGNFVFVLNNQNFYDAEFQKLGIDDPRAQNVVDYVTGSPDLSPDFTEAEATHLASVKSLFSTIRIIYFMSLLPLFFMVGYLLYTRQFNNLMPRGLMFGGAFSLGVLAVLFLFSLSFDTFFNTIHLPFFSSGSYIFPEDSLIIQLFPQQFFQDFTFQLFRIVFINSGVFFIIGVYLFRKQKNEARQHPTQL